MKRILACFAFLSVAAAAGSGLAACNSGPDFCTDDPRIPKLLSAKKSRLMQDFPASFVALLDIGLQCVARIEQSPDTFSLITFKPNGDSLQTQWDADNQQAANAQLDAGELSVYWIVHLRRAFQCDGEPRYDERPDYDANYDLNTSYSIRCDTSSACPVVSP